MQIEKVLKNLEILDWVKINLEFFFKSYHLCLYVYGCMHGEGHTALLLFRAWKQRMHQRAKHLAFSMPPSLIQIGPLPYTESGLNLGLRPRMYKRILNVIIGTFSKSMIRVCHKHTESCWKGLSELKHWNEDSNRLKPNKEG